MSLIDFKNKLASIHSYEEYQELRSDMALLQDLAQEVIRRHQLPEARLVLFSEGTNIVFSYGNSKVIKIFPPCHQNQLKSESLVLKALAGKLSVATPIIEFQGEIEGWPYIVMSQIEGILLETLWDSLEMSNKMTLIGELGVLIKAVHNVPIQGLEAIDCHWEQFVKTQLENCVKHHQKNCLPKPLLQQLSDYLKSMQHAFKMSKPVLLTGEYTPMNLLVKKSAQTWHINGLIDFGDCMLGLPQYDLLGPGVFLIQGDKFLLKEFLMAYGYSPQALTKNLSRQLNALMLLHLYSNLNHLRIKNWQERVHNLRDLENLVWGV